MTTEVDLLNTIHEYADMGLSGLNQVIPLSSDPSFTRELQHQKSDYEAALQKSEALLEERHVPRGKEAGPVAKMMSTVMTRAKNLVDPSTSRLAEMVFQGNNMGITELTKGINDYHGEDKVVLSFAEKQLKQEEHHAETMKTVPLMPHPAPTGGDFFLEEKLLLMIYLHEIRNVCFIPPFRMETGGYCKFDPDKEFSPYESI